MINSSYKFQEMPLVQLWMRDPWGISTMSLCCCTGKHLKHHQRKGTQVWFRPDPAGMFSDLYGILRWEPWWESLSDLEWTKPTSALALLCDSQNLLGSQMKWYNLMVSHWKHFQHWGIFILQFLSSLGLCYGCEAQALNSAPENLLWWFEEHLKCSLAVSQTWGALPDCLTWETREKWK